MIPSGSLRIIPYFTSQDNLAKTVRGSLRNTCQMQVKSTSQ